MKNLGVLLVFMCACGSHHKHNRFGDNYKKFPTPLPPVSFVNPTGDANGNQGSNGGSQGPTSAMGATGPAGSEGPPGPSGAPGTASSPDMGTSSDGGHHRHDGGQDSNEDDGCEDGEND